MQNLLLAIAAFGAFAFLGDYARRKPVPTAKLFSLGMSDGTGVVGTITRFYGWGFLIVGSFGTVFLLIRLVFDVVRHGTEF
jgi:hypothetical protein